MRNALPVLAATFLTLIPGCEPEKEVKCDFTDPLEVAVEWRRLYEQALYPADNPNVVLAGTGHFVALVETGNDDGNIGLAVNGRLLLQNVTPNQQVGWSADYSTITVPTQDGQEIIDLTTLTAVCEPRHTIPFYISGIRTSY